MVEITKSVEDQRKDIETKRKGATKKGLKIIVSVFFLDIISAIILAYVVKPSLGYSIVVAIGLFLLTIAVLILVEYFIWARNDILASFVDEGFIKVVVVGGKFRNFLMNYKGKAMDEEWNIINEIDPKALHHDKSWWGMHIIHPLFFGSIYSHVLSWRKYDPKKKAPVDRREILLQTSVMPYPYYIDALQAEDNTRAPIDVFTVVTMRIVNPYKALFGITTEWIEVITPRIQGAYVAFIKTHTFSELIRDHKATGSELLEFIKGTHPEAIEKLADKLLEEYGIEIISLDVIDIKGGDKETDEAIKANALAELKKVATITNAEAQAEKIKIEAEAIKRANVLKTMGVFVGQIAQFTGIEEDQVPEKLKDPEFRKAHEKEITAAIEFAKQTVSADANGLIQIISNSSGSSGRSGSGGINPDTLALFAALVKTGNLTAASGQSSVGKGSGAAQPAQSESTKQKKSTSSDATESGGDDDKKKNLSVEDIQDLIDNYGFTEEDFN
jgi:regulator of protease activity HflC (stomatin/prohibitin superfamily)